MGTTQRRTICLIGLLFGALTAGTVVTGAAATAEALTASASDQARLSPSAWKSIREQMYAKRFDFALSGQKAHAHNPTHRLDLELSPLGAELRLVPSSDALPRLGLRTHSLGRGPTATLLTAPKVAAQGARAILSYDNLSGFEEWFANVQDGFEHGYTLATRPRGKGEIQITMALQNYAARSVDQDRIVLQSLQGKEELDYKKLQVFDALGRALPARMEALNQHILIAFDDQGARYPITVDPLIQRPILLPNTTGPNDRHNFGVSIALSQDQSTLVVGDEDDLGYGAAYVYVRDIDGDWVLQQRLLAGDRSSGDDFGFAVAIAGDTIVVGAPESDVSGNRSGSAYVFVRAGDEWTQQAQLAPPTAQANANFGFSVGVSGDTAIVGANNFPGYGFKPVEQGAAEVFIRVGSAWFHQTQLVAGNAANNDNFGHSVAIDGDTAVVGAPFNDDATIRFFDDGSAYVFTRSETTWTQTKELLSSDPEGSEQFGRAVAISGDTVIIGTLLDRVDNVKTGSAFVFTRSGGAWPEQAKLLADDRASTDFFGFSVSVFGDTAIVGAQLHDGDGNDAGAAYVYTRSAEEWTQQSRLANIDGRSFRKFGTSVAIAGETAAVGSLGSDGAATVFNQDGIGAWTPQPRLFPGGSAQGDEFGTAIALSGNTAIVGVPLQDTGPAPKRNEGAAVIFVRSGQSWVMQQELIALDPEFGDFLGVSVALSGDTAVVGARFKDTGSAVGAAYVFVRNGATWSQQARLLPPPTDNDPFGEFGHAVGIEGDTIIIGSPNNDGGAFDSGAVDVFVRTGGNWTHQQKLVPNDASSEAHFGYAVAIHKGQIAIGAPDDSSVMDSAGAGYLFARDQNGDWVQIERFVSLNPGADEQFGFSTSIYDDTVLFGVPGDNFIPGITGSAFSFVNNNGTWEQEQIFVASSANVDDRFGHSVAIWRDTAAIAAHQDDDDGSNSGSTFIFDRRNGGWNERTRLSASDADAMDQFGFAVAVFGETVAVGAPFNDTDVGVDSGAAYVFEPNLDYGDAPSAAQSGFANSYPTLVADDGARHDRDGSTVMLGTRADVDGDGQPEPLAQGDDLNDESDEDGITFGTLEIGTTATYTVTATFSGFQVILNAWVDFDQSGSWEAGEQIATNTVIDQASETFSFAIPADAQPGTTYARFRLDRAGNIGPTGLAADGEVEDYQLTLTQPTLSVADASIVEGDSGTTNLQFTVSLTTARNTSASFDFATSNDTATTTGGDYTSTSGSRTLSGGPGTVTTVINVPIAGDTTFEPDEDFHFVISNASGATIVDGSAIGTIENDDPEPTASLSLSGSPFAEDGGVATVTATLSNPSHQDTTVNLAFAGTASAGDYNASATSILIAAGQTTGSITLTGVDDSDIEGDETVVVSIGAGRIKNLQEVTATIRDDDSPPIVSLSLADSPLTEDAGVATVTATLSSTFTQDVTVNLAFSGTAVAADYNASATQILITAGNESSSITLTGVDDNIFEGSETIIVDIDSVTDASEDGSQQVTATIADDETEPTVSLSLSNSPFGENGGVATVTATLSGPTTQATTVDLSFGGTAATGGIAPANDYSASGSQIVIAAGDLSGSIVLIGIDDETFEGDETVVVEIATVTKATENGEQQVTATISDDETAPQVSLTLSGNPLQEDGGVATVTAHLSNPSTQDVTVEFAFSGSATTSDYTASNLPLLIRAGFSSGISQIRGVADNTFEGDETIIVAISSVTNGSEAGEQQVTATITDDQTQPVVTLSSSADTFAESGGTATITATLNNASTQAVSLDLVFSGNATAEDYSRSAERIDIAPGATHGTITLTAIEDEIFEGSQNVEIAIGTVSNGVAGTPNNLALSIVDNDNPPRASLSLAGSPLAENGGIAVVTVSLSNPATVAIEVGLSFSGSASDPDYSASATQVLIQPGDTTGSINLTGLDDLLVEGDENIVVDIDTVTIGVEDGSQQVTAVISDDDLTPQPTPSPTPVPATPTPTAAPSPSPSPDASPPPPSPTVAASPSPSPSVSPAPPSPTAAASPSPSPGVSPPPPSPTAAASPSPSPRVSPPPPSPTAPPTTPVPSAPPETTPSTAPGPSIAPTDPITAPPSPTVSPSPSPTVSGRSGPVVEGPVARGSRNVAVLFFQVQNFSPRPGTFRQLGLNLESVSGTVEDFRSLRLVLDRNGNGEADEGESVVAEVTDILAPGRILMEFTQQVSLGGGQIAAFVLVADLN